MGLKYFEQVDPQHIDRHLILLGLFYASNGKNMMAEGLYGQALEKMEDQQPSYTKVMGMNLYGRLIMKNRMREQEAARILKASEQLGQALPFWYDKIEHLYLPEFDLD